MKIVLSITVAALALLSSSCTSRKHQSAEEGQVAVLSANVGTCPPGTNCVPSRGGVINQSVTQLKQVTEVHNHYQIPNPLKGIIGVQVGVGQPRRCLPQRVYYPQRRSGIYRGAIIAPENRPCPPRRPSRGCQTYGAPRGFYQPYQMGGGSYRGGNGIGWGNYNPQTRRYE